MAQVNPFRKVGLQGTATDFGQINDAEDDHVMAGVVCSVVTEVAVDP